MVDVDVAVLDCVGFFVVRVAIDVVKEAFVRAVFEDNVVTVLWDVIEIIVEVDFVVIGDERFVEVTVVSVVRIESVILVVVIVVIVTGVGVEIDDVKNTEVLTGPTVTIPGKVEVMISEVISEDVVRGSKIQLPGVRSVRGTCIKGE